MSLIGKIKDQVPIADIASRYIPLRKFGRRYKALCPFHSEKTASFTIYDTGKYHCFGCGANGDVIDLYARMNAIDTKEATKRLAAEFNIKAEYTPQEKKRQELGQFIKIKHETLKYLINDEIHILKRSMSGIRTEKKLERYGDLYHVLHQFEVWKHQIETAGSAKEILRLEKAVPEFIIDVYQTMIERESA